jgi:hypothetical protein
MAGALVQELNRSKKGRTGRLTYEKRKKRNIDVKRIKTKLLNGEWMAPEGIAKSVPARPLSPIIVDLSSLDFSL